MFTGLVETIGTVTALEPLDSSQSGGGGTSLTIEAPNILDDAHLGDSISVNGTCLTVTEFTANTFKVGIAPETLRRTNLGSLTQSSRVNLERALLPHTRLGGHFVQGHVDSVATITHKIPDGNATTFRFSLPSSKTSRDLSRYIVEKGYVTLDGASLTVTAVSDPAENWFEVMLIAYTQDKVVTAAKNVGDEVNVEIDVVGKYVEKSVAAYFEQILTAEDKAKDAPAILQKMVSRLVDEKLAKT